MKSSKKGQAFSLTGIEFILNIVAVIIIVVVVVTIIRNNNSAATYSGNTHFLLELEYMLFSKEGIMPDRYTVDFDSLDEKLDSLKIDDIALRLTVEYLDSSKEFYLDEKSFDILYPLRGFDKYKYDSVLKPVVVISDGKKHIGTIKIEYIFLKEETPKSVNKNA